MPPGDDGTLGLGERFTNLEVTLDRIELKLDRKVDVDTHNALAGRVTALESGESPLTRFTLSEFERMRSEVQELVRHGSQNSQNTERELVDVKHTVDQLSKDMLNTRSMYLAKQDNTNKRLKTTALVAAVLGAFGSIAGMTVGIAALVSGHV
jgi:hypothetical protein